MTPEDERHQCNSSIGVSRVQATRNQQSIATHSKPNEFTNSSLTPKNPFGYDGFIVINFFLLYTSCSNSNNMAVGVTRPFRVVRVSDYSSVPPSVTARVIIRSYSVVTETLYWYMRPPHVLCSFISLKGRIRPHTSCSCNL